MSMNYKFGINVHVPSDPKVLDYCVKAGAGWIRVDFNWVEIEPKERRFDWGRYDRIVDAAQERGLKVFASLAYSPGWANGGNDRRFPPTVSGKWECFCEAAAKQYKGRVEHWGLWNEPNHPDYGHMSVTQYIDSILVPGASAIRKGNPNAKTVGPDLTHDNDGSWAKWLNDILSKAPASLDIVSHHSYKDDFGGYNGYFSRFDSQFSWFFDLIGKPTLRSVLKKCAATGKPVWITESGWNAVKLGEAKQADCIRQWAKGLAALPWIEKAFIYELHDDPNVPAWGFGLLDSRMKPRPALGAYRDAMA